MLTISDPGPSSRPKDPTRWMDPQDGVVKLNTDASFLAGSGESTVGAFARNSEGMVLSLLIKD